MSNFKNKKDEYFKLVRDNFDIFQKIMDENKDNKNIGVLIMPNNEEEVDIARTILVFIIDSKRFVEYMAEGNLEDKPLEENYSYNLYLNLIKALKENDKKEIDSIKRFLEIIPPEQQAKYTYDAMCCLNNLPNFVETLCKKTGFNYEDALSFMQFTFCYEKAKEIANNFPNQIDFRNMNFNDRKIIKNIIEMVKELHVLYDNEMNKDKELNLEMK